MASAAEGVRLVRCTEEFLGARLERKWWAACYGLGLCGAPWKGFMLRGIRRCWMRSGRGIAASLTELEDRAIREVVERQIECGLDVVSDGEFRRWMFLNSFYDAVEGFRTDNVVTFRNDQGRPVDLAVHEIVDRLRPVDSPAAREAAFMASITRHPFKITFPAASIFGHPFTFKRGITDKGYVDLAEFVAHAIEIERALVADAIAAGAGHIQFDFPLYPYLVDPAWDGPIPRARA